MTGDVHCHGQIDHKVEQDKKKIGKSVPIECFAIVHRQNNENEKYESYGDQQNTYQEIIAGVLLIVPDERAHERIHTNGVQTKFQQGTAQCFLGITFEKRHADQIRLISAPSLFSR